MVFSQSIICNFVVLILETYWNLFIVFKGPLLSNKNKNKRESFQTNMVHFYFTVRSNTTVNQHHNLTYRTRHSSSPNVQALSGPMYSLLDIVFRNCWGVWICIGGQAWLCVHDEPEVLSSKRFYRFGALLWYLHPAVAT